MGEGAKKKRAAEARAAKKAKTAKATQLVEASATAASASTDPSDVPTRSNARNSKKTDTAPHVRSVPSGVRSVPTRQSSRSLTSFSTLPVGSGSRKHTSANLEGTDTGKTRPKRSATVAAMALLQELQFSETEETERDPEGVFTGNDEVDVIMELDEDEDEDASSGTGG